MDVSENELEIWFGAQDRIAVSIRPPGGDWIGPVEPREFIQNRMLGDGTMLSIYNEVYHPANGLNYISLYLSPFFSESNVIGVAAGPWLVRLHGREIRDGRYHAWIERDDPHRLGRVGDREAWAFPSFFTQASLVDNTTVSSLGCGQPGDHGGQPRRPPGTGSTSRAARARPATGARSPTSPRRARRSSPPRASPAAPINGSR